MANPFATQDIAAGYATSRPPVHRRILERARPHLSAPIPRALDVGCGAGLSTRALRGLADQSIGLEPAEEMVKWAARIAPESGFIVAAAEAIPVATSSISLITAAGSLNYVNLDLFFPEASRVLTPDGALLVYDFSPGVILGNGLENWFSQFVRRYPPPPGEAQPLDPTILARLNSGFTMRSQEQFAIDLSLTGPFYLEYMMTESNVAFAVRNGVPRQEIRAWCEDTLGEHWREGERRIRFHGYFACMTAR